MNFRALKKSIWVLEKSWKFVSEKGYEPWINGAVGYTFCLREIRWRWTVEKKNLIITCTSVKCAVKVLDVSHNMSGISYAVQQHFESCNMHTQKKIPVFLTGIKTISLRPLPLSYRRLVGCSHIFVFKNAETNISHLESTRGLKIWFIEHCRRPPKQHLRRRLHCQKKGFQVLETVLPFLRTQKIFFFWGFACDRVEEITSFIHLLC